MQERAHWTNAVTKATWTLLFAAVGAFVAWQLFRTLWPQLVIIAVLLLVYRLAVRGFHRDRF
jgi:hypothetical protein